MRESAALGGEARVQREDREPRLLAHHVAEREAETVAHAGDAPGERHAMSARAHEVERQRVRGAAAARSARRHQRLRREEATEDPPLPPAGVPEEAVLGDRLEVEAAEQLPERRAAHPAASRNDGITCSPKSSMERMTSSGGIL